MQAVLSVHIFRGWGRVKVENFKYSFSCTVYWSMDLIILELLDQTIKLKSTFEVFAEWRPSIKAKFD